MIIGLTGENCAGKGTVAEYLKKKSFYYLSLSDVLREELKKEGKAITRVNLLKKGNDLRKLHGGGVLAKMALMRAERDKNYVIDSIRTAGEVEELRKRKDFALVYVTAPPTQRFERMKKREREEDPQTFDGFMQIEEEEATKLRGCIEIADMKLVNESDIPTLYKKTDALLPAISSTLKIKRPSWDDYFMNIAKIVSTRSNCLKRHVAAIIVKDKKIISTGYNGTPRGTKNCDEGGCQRCMEYAEGGTKLEECLCSHGEENAIVQAAYHGVSTKGTTLYTTFAPCLMCTRMIINAGIEEVVYNVEYPLSENSFKLLKEAGIRVRQHKIE